ncbi:Senescence domain-containing protein [Cephalotus follicularis]|uniref:Senescence domain-containing protein n=1 Tax=Cephalotus follicularis TaxID=3775 RepID=A0A1Q3CXV6_CEPFO|nr:Senescence domain-containing protein [Cephalotus follicularis]
MKRIMRVKKLTIMSDKVAIGILSGVVKVSGFFTSSIVNSKAGKKFFSLLLGEIVLASFDRFSESFTLTYLYFFYCDYCFPVCVYMIHFDFDYS